MIGLEIYPVNSDEYAYLHACGADYVTVFQETYNSDKYETLHLAGHKRIYPYRVNAQERAIRGGMRGVGFGALLGLDDFRKDAFATGYHAYLLQRKYPHAEIAFSCPRLRPIINNDRINPMDVHEKQLLQVVCAYRLFMPFASITVSTRECARVRDNLVGIAATKISAGVSTGIGSHVDDIEDKGDDQFEISDGRNVEEVYNALLSNNLQPVMSDYNLCVGNNLGTVTNHFHVALVYNKISWIKQKLLTVCGMKSRICRCVSEQRKHCLCYISKGVRCYDSQSDFTSEKI